MSFYLNSNNYNDTTIQQVWEKGRIVSGYDPSVYRKDTCNAWIIRNEYGNTNHDYGWEIDHIIPTSASGTDNLSNLQPLQWKNNRYKGDNYPNWSCAVTSNA